MTYISFFGGAGTLTGRRLSAEIVGGEARHRAQRRIVVRRPAASPRTPRLKLMIPPAIIVRTSRSAMSCQVGCRGIAAYQETPFQIRLFVISLETRALIWVNAGLSYNHVTQGSR
jgi:hypothetical protein